MKEGDLSKLLGTPFRLTLITQDVNQFLHAKISKKIRLLEYYETFTGKEGSHLQPCVTLNLVIFFITVWGASTKYWRKLEAQSATTFGLEKNNTSALKRMLLERMLHEKEIWWVGTC